MLQEIIQTIKGYTLEKKPYTCETSGKKFSQGSKLKGHKRQHTEETPYACDVCGKRFRLSTSCRKHQMRHN